MTVSKGTVGIVTPRYTPYRGGIERHVEALALGLVRANIRVEIITTDPDGQLPPQDELDGVPIRRFRTVGNDGIFFISPALGYWLSNHAGRYAVLHAHSYHTPLALQAAIASRRNHVPFVFTPHYHGTGHSRVRRLLHWPYRPFGAWLIYQAQKIFCVSEVENQLLKKHFGPGIPTLIAPNGVDFRDLVKAQPHQKDPGRIVVLTVGRQELYKQTDRLLAALHFLPETYDIVVIGDGPARPGLDQLAVGLQGRAKILGNVSQSDLLAWYRAADVFVTLSKHEAFGMTLLEAAIAGATVISSDIAAHREVAKYLPADRVTFIPANCSPGELAQVIQATPRPDSPSNLDLWPLPSWSTTVQTILSVYRAIISDDLLIPNMQEAAKN